MSLDRMLPRDVGRYRLYDEIASGGMATVHVGRLRGPAGFARTVAIKRLHPQYAHDPEFVSMFLDEARLAARIHHPNVAAILDVVALRGELFLVMEYVRGETLSRLLPACEKAGAAIPYRVASTILLQALLGLHAAHEARDHRGSALNMVHRDVSPQNIMIGADGITRMLDFGVAKAATRLQTTGHGQVKGKLSYMAPEQLRLEPIDRRTDVFAAGVVLWEALTGKRLFAADDPGTVIARILTHVPEPPSRHRKDIPPALDQVVAQALQRQKGDRFVTALEFAKALERAVAPVGALQISEWVYSLAGPVLEARERTVAAVEIASESTLAELAPVDDSVPPTPVQTLSHEVEEATEHHIGKSLAAQPRTSPWLWAALAAVLLAAVVGVGRMLSADPDPPLAATSHSGAHQAVSGETNSSSKEGTSGPASKAPETSEPPQNDGTLVVDPATAEPNPVASHGTSPLGSAPPSTKPTAPPSSPRLVAPKPRTKPTSEPVRSGNCTPPYSITPDGLKKFKPECFK